MKGYFAKKNTEPKKILKEFRVENNDEYKEELIQLKSEVLSTDKKTELLSEDMKEMEMEKIGGMIIETLERIEDDNFHKETRKKVRDLCDQFPLHLELTNK